LIIVCSHSKYDYQNWNVYIYVYNCSANVCVIDLFKLSLCSLYTEHNGDDSPKDQVYAPSLFFLSITLL